MRTLKDYTDGVNMVLLNKAPEVDPDLFDNIEAGAISEEDELYQYYVIDEGNGEWLVENFPDYLVLFYSEILDSYILGVKFLDNWGNVIKKVL